MKPIFSNMGFILQISGLFTMIPILLSFYYKEQSATIVLFITATVFFVLGFVMNALCERKELNFKESCSLIVLVFVSLSLIGSIPYFIVFDTNIFEKFTNSVFESASGFATVGYSMIADISIVPNSIIFYRSLTQFIGGIGIVYVLLIFLFPEEKLRNFSKSIGIDENSKIKKTMGLILAIYIIYAILMVGLSYLMGYTNLLNSTSMVFSGLSTGGFAPINDISTLPYFMKNILIITMYLGAMNFIVLAGLFKFKFREFLNSEVPIFILFSAFAVGIMQFISSMGFFDSFFHVVSIMTTTGFGYVNLGQLSPSIKLFLIVLMFIGGTSLSTAGGLKIYRLILIFKSIKKSINDSITNHESPVKLFGKEYSNQEIIQAMVMAILMIFIIFSSAFIMSLFGHNYIDSLFEVTSAISGTGLSVGIIGINLDFTLKWLVIAIMILGRVEILAFFIMIAKPSERER
jgi:trk system potassium uptake protein TrkH